MEECASSAVEFYMTICPCRHKDANHRSAHNSFVAVRVAELLSYVGFISEDKKFDVSSCCTETKVGDQKPNHKKHYILVRVSEPILEYTASLLNQGFSASQPGKGNLGEFNF